MGSVVSLAGSVPRAAEDAAARRVPPEESASKTDFCTHVLNEARRQVAARRFGPLLGQLLARACDLLDEMDEVMLGLDPRRDHDAFRRVATLHRDLEEIQSLVPPKYRSLARGNGLG
jgi:hypothetical protein